MKNIECLTTDDIKGAGKGKVCGAELLAGSSNGRHFGRHLDAVGDEDGHETSEDSHVESRVDHLAVPAPFVTYVSFGKVTY